MSDSGLGGRFARMVGPVWNRVHGQHSSLATVQRFCMLMFGLLFFAAVSVSCEQPESPVENQPAKERTANAELIEKKVAEESLDKAEPSELNKVEPIEKLGPRTYCHANAWARPRILIRGTSLAWRVDGSEIIFSYGPDIHAISPDGRQLRTLAVVFPPDAEAAPWDTTTAFSLAPDESGMVYATCEFARSQVSFDYHELALVDVDTVDRLDADPRRLTSNTAFDYFPAWSPDGQRIAFLRGLPHRRYVSDIGLSISIDHTSGSLHVMRADGTDVRSIGGGHEAALVGPPRWSPDGRWLAFVNDDGESGTGRTGDWRGFLNDEGETRLGLYIVNADGTERRRLADAASEVAWSPDSRQLAYIRLDGERRALYTITVTGDAAVEQRVADLDRVVVAEFGRPPPHLPLVAWSPKGAYIVYECEDDRLCIVTPEGARIGGPLYGHAAAWSPDESRLAVVVGDPAIRVWHSFPDQLGIQLLGGDRTIRMYTVAPDGSDRRVLVREQEDGGLVAAAAA